jgi:hypothetical protein
MKTQTIHELRVEALVNVGKALLADKNNSIRWRYLGCGECACTICGARASEDYTDAKCVLVREEKCSPNCAWQRLENILEVLN